MQPLDLKTMFQIGAHTIVMYFNSSSLSASSTGGVTDTADFGIDSLLCGLVPGWSGISGIFCSASKESRQML